MWATRCNLFVASRPSTSAFPFRDCCSSSSYLRQLSACQNAGSLSTFQLASISSPERLSRVPLNDCTNINRYGACQIAWHLAKYQTACLAGCHMLHATDSQLILVCRLCGKRKMPNVKRDVRIWVATCDRLHSDVARRKLPVWATVQRSHSKVYLLSN